MQHEEVEQGLPSRSTALIEGKEMPVEAPIVAETTREPPTVAKNEAAVGGAAPLSLPCGVFWVLGQAVARSASIQSMPRDMELLEHVMHVEHDITCGRPHLNLPYGVAANLGASPGSPPYHD